MSTTRRYKKKETALTHGTARRIGRMEVLAALFEPLVLGYEAEWTVRAKWTARVIMRPDEVPPPRYFQPGRLFVPVPYPAVLKLCAATVRPAGDDSETIDLFVGEDECDALVFASGVKLAAPWLDTERPSAELVLRSTSFVPSDHKRGERYSIQARFDGIGLDEAGYTNLLLGSPS